jgi:hypothetical protein
MSADIPRLYDLVVAEVARQITDYAQTCEEHSCAYTRTDYDRGLNYTSYSYTTVWTRTALTGDSSLPESFTLTGQAHFAFPLDRITTEVFEIVGTGEQVVLRYRPGSTRFRYTRLKCITPSAIQKFPGYVGTVGNYAWFRSVQQETGSSGSASASRG